MKRLLFISIIFLSIQLNAQPSDEQQLKNLIQNSFDDIFSEMNVESISDYFTDDFLLLEQGEVWDLEKLKSMLNPEALGGMKRLNEFEFIQITIDGKRAWIAYHNKAIFEKDEQIAGEVNWLESATAIKTTEGWRLDMLHSTRKPSTGEK